MAAVKITVQSCNIEMNCADIRAMTQFVASHFFEAHFQLTASSLITSASGEPNDWRKNLAIFPGKSLESIIIYGLKLWTIAKHFSMSVPWNHARVRTYTNTCKANTQPNLCACVRSGTWLSSYLQPFKCVFLFQLSTFIKFCFLSWYSF